MIEEMIELFKTGNPYLNISRFEFRDPDRSFLILDKGETTFIGKTYNLVFGKCEEFQVKDIDKIKFLHYLESFQKSMENQETSEQE